jgi:CDI toxin RNase A-like protein
MARHLISQLISSLLLASFLIGGSSCQPPQKSGDFSGPSTRSETLRNEPRRSSVSRDLSQDEAAGGHTLRKHVGRTDQELRERLQHERHIAAASTWTDRGTAEQAVGAALSQNNDKIQRWLSRTGGHPNLVIDFDSDNSLGRTLQRDSNQSQPCNHALIVLKWDPNGSYYVLTSYPECR